MLSGYFAGQQIAQALEKGEPTKEALWGYNKRYIDTYGKKQARLTYSSCSCSLAAMKTSTTACRELMTEAMC